MKEIVTRFVVAAALSAVAVGAQQTPLVSSHKAIAPATGGPVGALVAKVNGAGLSQRDLDREMQKLFPYTGVHKGRLPKAYAEEIRRKALNQIVYDELLHQEAKRRKMTVSAAIFSDVQRQAMGRFPSQSAYQSYAVQEYGSVKAFENQLRRAILIAKLVDQEITQKSRVSDAQARQFYAANKQRFLKPESVWIQSISFNFPQNATAAQRAQTRKRAEEVLSKARATKTYEEFGKLAEQFSEDDWRIMMGDHQWIHRGRLPSAVEKVAFTLKPGDTSGIIETSEAFVIVRINAVQPQKQIPYREVGPTLRADMEKAKTEDLRIRLEQRLRRTHKVEEL